MASRRHQTDVLVVGAGPVGLSLGLQLRHHRVDFTLVEAGSGQVDHPRVGSVGPRSMEFFRRWGVAGPIRAAGWPDDHPLDIAWVTALGGHEIHRLGFGTVRTRPVPPYTPEPEQVCPQHWLIPLLIGQLGACPAGPVRLRWRLDGFVQHDDRVEATVTNVDRLEQVTVDARHLVACDGASSPIRKACGVDAPARHPAQLFRNILFRAPDLGRQMADRRALVYFLTSPRLLRYPLRAIDGDALFRLTARGAGDERTPADPYDLLAEAIAFDTPVKVLSDENWALTHRVAASYRHGRVFFCGDAAHTLSPSGGFGMNTGIADAADLGWKLAAAVHGWAGARLLDSYQSERQPVAEASLEQSNRNLTRTTRRQLPPEIVLDSPAGERARAELARRMDTEGVRREFEAPDMHFGYRYQAGFTAGEAVAGEDWSTGAPPGVRAPHGWVEPGVSTLDLFGPGFTLLCLGGADGAEPDERRSTAELAVFARAFAAAKVPLAIRQCPGEDLVRRYRRRFVLVRPDDHVSWRGDSLAVDPRWLADLVRGA